MICFNCSKAGHSIRQCTVPKRAEKEIQEAVKQFRMTKEAAKGGHLGRQQVLSQGPPPPPPTYAEEYPLLEKQDSTEEDDYYDFSRKAAGGGQSGF
jgi:pyocin large subunit-like protein